MVRDLVMGLAAVLTMVPVVLAVKALRKVAATERALGTQQTVTRLLLMAVTVQAMATAAVILALSA